MGGSVVNLLGMAVGVVKGLLLHWGLLCGLVNDMNRGCCEYKMRERFDLR